MHKVTFMVFDSFLIFVFRNAVGNEPGVQL